VGEGAGRGLRDIGARTQKRNKLWDDSSDVGKKLKKNKKTLRSFFEKYA
jgi:hypothetical protein